MENKLLTIAIPTYNRSYFLDKLLNSIFQQYDERLEVIVSDNASTDNTEEIIKKYDKVNYIRNITNIGPDANFLQCYKKASAKYVWLVGSDDILYPGAINKIINFLDKNKKLTHVFLNHNFFKFEENPVENNNYYLNIKENLLFDDKNKWIKIIGNRITFMSAMIISKEVFNNVINPIKYNGTWFIHTCIILESSASAGKYGIIKDCCVCDNITPANANQDKEESWIFEVFGEKLYKVYYGVGINYGFRKKIMKRIYSKFVCGNFGRAIIRMKVNKINWKKEFYQYAFPYMKKYLMTWLFTIPCSLLPRFICSFMYTVIKPLYKKIIKR